MSDSPLPIPSGYICHTSCAIGKGRQPQQHDCPSSHPPSPYPYSATPISPPRANIYWSPSKASFCILSASLSFSYYRAASLPYSSPRTDFLPTRPLHVLPWRSFSSFFLSPSFFPRFQEKEKHGIGLGCRRAVKTLAAVLRDASFPGRHAEGKSSSTGERETELESSNSSTGTLDAMKIHPTTLYSWKPASPAVQECHSSTPNSWNSRG